MQNNLQIKKYKYSGSPIDAVGLFCFFGILCANRFITLLHQAHESYPLIGSEKKKAGRSPVLARSIMSVRNWQISKILSPKKWRPSKPEISSSPALDSKVVIAASIYIYLKVSNHFLPAYSSYVINPTQSSA